MNEIKLNELSVNDLKAYAYDAIVQIERLQQTLNALNQEIAKRSQEENNLKPV